MKKIRQARQWKGRTVITLNADHGGLPGTKNHGASDQPYNHTIPFMVWGASAARGNDLYKLNPTTCTNAGVDLPTYAPTS